MPIPNNFKSPQNWKKSSYDRFKKPRRKNFERKNEPLGKKLFRVILSWIKRGGKTNNGRKELLRGAAILGAMAILLGGIIFVGALAWYGRDLPDPNKLYERNITQSTKIYDRTGEHLLYDIYDDKKRTVVQLDELPPYIAQATLALEDQNFYKHKGFSLWGMFRGVFISQLKGKRAAGGSTITQQLIKNAILTNERTVSRKIKELILAYRMEKKYSKDEILQMYLNEIPYGSTAYGIEAASETYFGKNARDLSLAEAAILASLPKAPTYFSPYGSHVEELTWRQHHALDEMLELGYITEEEAQGAKNEEIKFKQRVENIQAPHFVMYVKELLTEKYGEKLVERGGLKVYTTLDMDKQKAAEEAVTEGIEKVEQYGGNNAALTAIDPQTGQILAMVGSRDFFDIEHDGQVNVTIRPRQPGSSFKPIVYAAAFEKGYTPETILYDVVTTFKTDIKDYIPKNYDLTEHGPVTIRKALAGSLNIPAVKAIYLAGINRVLDLAEEMGYTTFSDRSRFGLSLVLGGGEVKLLEHVSAFGSFAQDGKHFAHTPILKIEDNEGNILEEYKKDKESVLDKNVARQITDILSDDDARAYVFGTGSKLTLPGRPVTAKTGTTNDYRDAWTVGYTPSLVAGAWVGNNDNSEMKRGAAGGVVAAPIWNNFMQKALEGSAIENFEEPELIEVEKPILAGGENFGQETIRIDRFSGKLATKYTPEEAIEEKKFQVHHSILHYVDKDAPQGPLPEDPSIDPQYESWEAAILAWADEQGFEAEEPPTEFDDVHLPKYEPNINITSHDINETITDRNIEITVDTNAPRGTISRVRYYIDDNLVGTSYSYPFTLYYHIGPEFENGFHNLRVVAYDDVLNNSSAEITLNFMLPNEGVSISWIGPQNNAKFYSSSFPLVLNVNASTIKNVAKIDFYYQKNGDEKHLIDSLVNPTQNQIEGHWNSSPREGDYTLFTEITEESGANYKSGEININIE